MNKTAPQASLHAKGGIIETEKKQGKKQKAEKWKVKRKSSRVLLSSATKESSSWSSSFPSHVNCHPNVHESTPSHV